MPHKEKTGKKVTNIPNFSDYAFVDNLPPFQETDRLLENELSQLPCHNNYELEPSLSHFSDSMLNNHLYTIEKGD